MNLTASIMLPFHSPSNEPKEVSLQNPNTFMEDHNTTLVVIIHVILLSTWKMGEGLKNAKTLFFRLTQCGSESCTTAYMGNGHFVHRLGMCIYEQPAHTRYQVMNNTGFDNVSIEEYCLEMWSPGKSSAWYRGTQVRVVTRYGGTLVRVVTGYWATQVRVMTWYLGTQVTVVTE